jgi:NAD(P)-dependent dehydrogenase (short-subunit alcohol dehydrogenase family)
MRYLDGKTALITAGGGGIARATAKLFAQEGARLMLADLNPQAAERVAAEVRAAGAEAYATSADVLAAADCMRAVGQTVDRFGRLDVLINLVGSFGQKGGGTVDKVSLEDWDWMMDINLKSVFMMSKYAIPAMLAGGGGSIVNTGTTAAVMGRSGSPCYGTTKSGVLALTRAMAADYFKQGLRVNAVCPSGTLTPMYTNAAGRGARNETELAQRLDEMRKSNQGLSLPEEIAPSFLFLASDQLSRKVTGHILMADNGFSMMRL